MHPDVLTSDVPQPYIPLPNDRLSTSKPLSNVLPNIYLPNPLPNTPPAKFTHLANIPAISSLNLVSEVTPLLQSARRIPWFQLSILWFLQVVEPLTSNVIHPSSPEPVHDIGITFGDESHVGYFVGLLQSLPSFMEAATVLYWSKMSDKVGRKPIIIMGLFGSALSTLFFGLSESFWAILLSRCLRGASSGNISIIKSMMAEMVDPEDLARVYAFTPLAWSLGATLGPAIGGSLSRPKDQSPDTLGQFEFLKPFPYLLPCAVPTLLALISILITHYLLRETVKSPAPISSIFKKPTNQDELLPSGAIASSFISKLPFDPNKALPFRTLLTWPVIIACANYACLSLVDTAFRSIQPLFLSTPISHGGLDLPPAAIGKILSIYGIMNSFVQMLLFARVHESLGTRNTFMLGIASSIPLFLAFPVTSFLAKTQSFRFLLWLMLGVQVILPIGFSLSFGAIFMSITAAAPTPDTIGTINGLSQTLASTMKGIGPGIANGLFLLSVEKHYLGGYLVYYVLAMIAILAYFVATFLPHNPRNPTVHNSNGGRLRTGK